MQLLSKIQFAITEVIRFWFQFIMEEQQGVRVRDTEQEVGSPQSRVLKRLQLPTTSFRRVFFLLVVVCGCTFTQSLHAFAPKNGVACLRWARRIEERWTQPDISKAGIISQSVVLLAQPSE